MCIRIANISLYVFVGNRPTLWDGVDKERLNYWSVFFLTL